MTKSTPTEMVKKIKKGHQLEESNYHGGSRTTYFYDKQNDKFVVLTRYAYSPNKNHKEIFTEFKFKKLLQKRNFC